MSLPLSPSISLILLFALVPPALRTRSLHLCPAPVPCPGLSSPSLPAQGGTARSQPGRHPGGLRVWRIPSSPLFCSSIIDRISSACCTRRAHGIFCSNRAARFPRPTPVCRGRGARERKGAAAQCPGQCQRCAPHPSLAAAPRPGALQAQLSTAGACRSGVELVSTDATLPPLRPGAAPGQEEALFMDGAGRPSGSCIPSSGVGGISLV